jgi:hypothetical protein
VPKKKAAKKATNSKMNDTSKGARTPKITTAKKATEAKKNPTKKVGNCAIHENFPFDRGKKKGSDSPIQTFIVPFLKFHLQNSLVFMPYLTHFQKQNFMLHPYQQLKEEKREKGDVSIPFISPFIFCVFIIIIIDYIPFRSIVHTSESK